MAEHLMPLADYSRQPAQVGTGGFYLFTADGQKLSTELFRLSLELRRTRALEIQQQNLLLVMLPADQVPAFRDMLGERADDSLTIISYQFLDAQQVEVWVSYASPDLVFFMGRMWQLRKLRLGLQEGGPADE